MFFERLRSVISEKPAKNANEQPPTFFIYFCAQKPFLEISAHFFGKRQNPKTNKLQKEKLKEKQTRKIRMTLIKNQQDIKSIKLSVDGRTYIPTVDTAQLLEAIGGVETLKAMTAVFYKRVFKDPNLSLFFQDTAEPHAERLANWVAEKMAGGDANVDYSKANKNSSGNVLPNSTTSTMQSTFKANIEYPHNNTMEQIDHEDSIQPSASECPLKQVRGVTDGIRECPIWIKHHPWTYEREMFRDLTRKTILVPKSSPFGRTEKFVRQSIVVHDRSSAHFAGWHSPKRHPSDIGKHFKLDDTRIWLRLHMWAGRSVGLFETNDWEEWSKIDPVKVDSNTIKFIHALNVETKRRFQDWYTKFIAHFSRVYERSAPPFVPLELDWSAKVSNLKQYINNSRQMSDIAGITNPDEAIELLDQEDIEKIDDIQRSGWPYDDSLERKTSGD